MFGLYEFALGCLTEPSMWPLVLGILRPDSMLQKASSSMKDQVRHFLLKIRDQMACHLTVMIILCEYSYCFKTLKILVASSINLNIYVNQTIT